MTDIKVEISGPVATVSMAREPVNSLNLPMWKGLLEALTALENNSTVRAVIFASDLKKCVGRCLFLC
jgi:3,2-trans-enoyl-CoA isomerase